MSSLEEQCSAWRLPRQVFSAETLKANIGAQVGIVRATTWPWRTFRGRSRAKIGGLPKKGLRTCSGLWRASSYLGGEVPSTGFRMPIRASEGVPRNSLKKLISFVVESDSFAEGLARVMDQATILPSKGTS